jgi:cytochrome c oxidase subunit II
MLQRLGLLPVQASTVAGRVDALYFFLIGVSVFFSVLIAVLLLRFAVKYRRRSDADQAEQIHGSLVLEVVWTLIPFGLAMVIFVWSASLFVSIKRPPDDALDVFVVGKQWMWKLQHLEGRREINELHIPIGRAVKLTLTSEDVIHSFFVPAFRIKQDAVPGRYTTAWFQATRLGTYHLFCAEYCGTEHSRMIGHIVVMEPSAYQAWLSEEAGAAAGPSKPVSLEAGGADLFQQLGCITCHRGTSGALGPSLAGVFGSTVHLEGGGSLVADETYIRESILSPRAKIVEGYRPVMPTFQGQVSEEALLQLVAYIKSLRKGERDS